MIYDIDALKYLFSVHFLIQRWS